MLIRCCGNGIWAANAVAASVGSSAVLLRRCGGGCGKFERGCGVVMLWCCGYAASVRLQQLRRGWFCAWTRRLVGEGSRHPIIGGVFCSLGGACSSNLPSLFCRPNFPPRLIFNPMARQLLVTGRSGDGPLWAGAPPTPYDWMPRREGMGGGDSWRGCARARARIANTCVC